MESNPYLTFSRNWGVPYGDVLSFISAYEKKFRYLTFWEKKACRELQKTATAGAILELRKRVRIEVFKDAEEIARANYNNR